MQTTPVAAFGALVLAASAHSAPRQAAPARAATTQAGSIALRATRVHVGDGTVVENGLVLLTDGKIEAVGKGVAVPKDVRVVELEGDLTPGLVVLRDHSGAAGEDRDETRPLTPTMDLAWAFDPDHSQMHALLEQGVTSFVLAPSSGNLVGGLAAVVKPGARVLAREVFLHVDMSSDALAFNRFPTSYAGAIEELEKRFTDPEGVFAKAVGGEQPVMLVASSRAEIQRAVDFALRHSLAGVLAAGPRVGELAVSVKGAGMGVVLPPRGVGADPRGDASAKQLAEAGVPFGFALDAPRNGAAALRLTVGAAVGAGLSHDAALRALTHDAAKLAGVADHVGSIAAGRDADLVLWSGHPADPASRVLSVWVDGERLHHDPAPDPDDEDSDEEDSGGEDSGGEDKGAH